MSDFSPRALASLKKRLLELKRDLEQLLEGQHEQSEPVKLDQQSVGRVSRIDAIQQQQMARAGEAQTLRRLGKVNAALQRFETQDYGYCLDCDEPIVLARLQVKPEAEYCITCQAGHD